MSTSSQLANADARQLADAVRRLFEQPRNVGGTVMANPPVVTVDERTNSLVVSATGNDWDTVETIIRQLDAAPQPGHKRYHQFAGDIRQRRRATSTASAASALQDDRDAYGLAQQPAHLSQEYFADTVKASDGNLAVANNTATVSQVQNLLDRLRTNMGQRVAVGSRNIAIRSADAKTAGIAWTKGPGGVQYAVANEGQLMGLLDIEQRQAAAEAQVALRGEVRQEAIVGTDARLANGRTVTISEGRRRPQRPGLRRRRGAGGPRRLSAGG